MSLPADLVPLPTAPWGERPAELPLVIEECRTALWKTRGNISRAAELLKITPKRMRDFVNKSEYLLGEQREAQEQLLDAAEDVVFEALTDDADPGRKDSMARFILPQLGQGRGYGSNKGVNLSLGGRKGAITISWADGSDVLGNPGDDAKVIDGSAVSHD